MSFEGVLQSMLCAILSINLLPEDFPFTYYYASLYACRKTHLDLLAASPASRAKQIKVDGPEIN
jgi:hypothetical protein